MAVYSALLKQYQQLNQRPHAKTYFNLFATLVLLIVLVVMIYPALGHITTLNKEITDARVQKDGLAKKIEALELARINLINAEADLVFLDLALPTGSNVPSQVKRLEDFASKNAISLGQISISEVPLNKPSEDSKVVLNNFPFDIVLSGGFEQFKVFLSDLENSIRTSYVESISLSKDTTGVKETITGRTFYLDLDKGLESTAEVASP